MMSKRNEKIENFISYTRFLHTHYYGKSVITIIACLCFFHFLADETFSSDHDDETALTEIFGSEATANTFALLTSSSSLSKEVRYERLFDAVFPTGSNSIRIDIDFAPCYPPAKLADQYSSDFNLNSILNSESIEQSPVGGTLLAPASELIKVASQLERINEVEEVVASLKDGSDTFSKELLAVEFLIAVTKDEIDVAEELLIEFYKLVTTTKEQQPERGPEAVVMWTAAQIPELRVSTNDLVFLVYEQTRASGSIKTERWQRQVFALKYLLEWLVSDRSKFDTSRSGEVSHWKPVIRTKAWTNGQGFPPSLWEARPGFAFHLTGHERDYLYYEIPLTGNFSVEADISTFNYRDTRLGYGGVWAGPGYDHKAILNGDFDDDRDTITISPKLDPIDEPMRVRLEVRDDLRTTFINGRAVYESEVSAGDPWLSIIGLWYTHGWVKNLRISGKPRIPAEIDLATAPELPGWNPYYNESSGNPDSDWRLIQESKLYPDVAKKSETLILQGDCDPENAGSFQESLLRYHRPMFEDGIISYEFYYQQGKFDVHPALDRLAFVLNPQGVQEHLLTDWKYERNGLDPGAATINSTAQIGNSTLPLMENQWNRLDLQIEQNIVTLTLNDQKIYETQISGTNSRAFGFFHYADQTEALIRNIHWRGDWPKQLPDELEQNLADDRIELLLADKDLPMSFEHDFAEGVDKNKFLTLGDIWRENSKQLDDGIHLHRKGANHYVDYSFAPHVQLHGDFDVIAEFEDFSAEVESGGDGNIQLFVGLDNLHEYRMYRKFSKFEDKELGDDIIQAAYFYLRNEERQFTYPRKLSDATSSGKLRLVRRGNQMHYLYAQSDSENYRLVHTEQVSDLPTRPGDIRLKIETNRPGNVQVTWKSLKIRAEKMTGLALQPSYTVAELDEARERLMQKHDFDFSNIFTFQKFTVWGSDQRRISPDGFEFISPGKKNWYGSGFSPHLSLEGDFDIAVNVSDVVLDTPAPGGESTAYLEVEFKDLKRTAIQIKFARSSHGYHAAECTWRRTKVGNNLDYEEMASEAMDSVSQLRLVRKNGIVHALIKPNPEEPPMILARIDVGNHPVPMNHIRSVLHTGGEDRESTVLYKSMSVAAEKIQAAF